MVEVQLRALEKQCLISFISKTKGQMMSIWELLA